MSTLIAGPWSGSTHGELLCWQGWLRRMSKSYDKTIVVAPTSKSFLYEDFATEIHSKVLDSYAGEGPDCKFVSPSNVPAKFVGTDVVVTDQDIISLSSGPIMQRDRDQIEFELAIDCPLNVGFERNAWAKITCEINNRYNIAWLADDKQECHRVYGLDARKYDLKAKVDIVKKSKVVVSFSKGTTAIAVLAEVPFITMVARSDTNFWTSQWNPFQTPGIAFKGKPTVNQIIEGIDRLMSLWDRSNYEPPAYQDQSYG